MRKLRLSRFRRYLVRTLLYVLAFGLCVAMLGGGLLLVNNPLPFVAPCSLAFLFLFALGCGYLCSREEGVCFSLLSPLTLYALCLLLGLVLSRGKISLLALLYAVLFVGAFLLGRVLPHPKRRHKRFE